MSVCRGNWFALSMTDMPTEWGNCLSSRLRQVSVCQEGRSSAIFAVRTLRTANEPAKRGHCLADWVSAGIGAEGTTGPHLVFSLISFQPVPACASLRQPATAYDSLRQSTPYHITLHEHALAPFFRTRTKYRHRSTTNRNIVRLRRTTMSSTEHHDHCSKTQATTGTVCHSELFLEAINCH